MIEPFEPMTDYSLLMDVPPYKTPRMNPRAFGLGFIAFVLGIVAAFVIGGCSVLPQHVPHPQAPAATDALYRNGNDTTSLLTIKPDGTFVITNADTTRTGRWQRDTVNTLEMIRFVLPTDSTCEARLTRLWIHDLTACLTPVRSWKQSPINKTFP